MNKEIKAYLYPNPLLKGKTLTNIWGESYRMKNKPFLELEFFGFPKGKYKVKIFHPIYIERKINITSSYTSLIFFNDRLANPKLQEIELNLKRGTKKEEFILPLSVHKIYGKVRRFDGTVCSPYFWCGKTISRADSKGNFIFYYPEGKKLRLFIDDESYSKTTLECWIITDNLKTDLKINPKIGNFELYDINAWFSAGLLYIFFIPASLPLLKKSKKVKWKLPIGVDFNKKDKIKVWINEEEAKVKGIIKLPTNGKRYYPAYLIVANYKGISYSPKIIKVRVNSPDKGEGEAFYISY